MWLALVLSGKGLFGHLAVSVLETSALVSSAGRLVIDFHRSFVQRRLAARPAAEGSYSARGTFLPLRRVVLTDGVGRTLFEEYADHRVGSRGDEETGWVLLGIREEGEAVVLGTLPAGTERDAGVGHVQFNSAAQIVGSRIVRQIDRRLTIVGVVHTHPGSLRHPSDGDLRGDNIWVGQLRGKEGIFGIGTADGKPGLGVPVAYQPKPNMHSLDKLRFSWYALREGDKNYRPLPVDLTIGPDLARPLHLVWTVIESHADRLDRLYRQQSGITFEVMAGEQGPALAVKVPLAKSEHALQILLDGKEVRYYWLRDGEPLQVDPKEDRIDRAIYLLLAELAAQDS
jgi:Prokaryotic homologs of the JAB domain